MTTEYCVRYLHYGPMYGPLPGFIARTVLPSCRLATKLSDTI